MRYFGAKYSGCKPTKNRRNHPVPRGESNRQQGVNVIINIVVDEILPNETQKVSVAREET